MGSLKKTFGNCYSSVGFLQGWVECCLVPTQQCQSTEEN